MNERLRILDLIESGEISVAEAVQRLEELGRADPGNDREPERVTTTDSPENPWPSEKGRHPTVVRLIWQIVFGFGVAMVGGGGLLLSRAYGREQMPGLAWGWALFGLGLLVLMFGWWLQRARWFYLRVREQRGRALTLALPLPFDLVAWLLRVLKPVVPKLQDLDVDGLILTMQEELRQGRGIVIRVDEGDVGDRVEMVVR